MKKIIFILFFLLVFISCKDSNKMDEFNKKVDNVDITNYDEIINIIDEYEKLNDADKALIVNIDKVYSNKKQMDETIENINTLIENANYDSNVDEINEKYNVLTLSLKNKITNYNKLKQINDYKKALNSLNVFIDTVINDLNNVIFLTLEEINLIKLNESNIEVQNKLNDYLIVEKILKNEIDFTDINKVLDSLLYIDKDKDIFKDLLQDDYSYSKSKLLLLDTNTNYIELEGISINQLSSDTLIYKLDNGTLTNATVDDLMIGMENIYVKYDEKKISKILIDGNPIFNRMRVAIRNRIDNISDLNTLYHDSIEIEIKEETEVYSYTGDLICTLSPNKTYKFTYKDNAITFQSYKVYNRIILKEGSLEKKVISIKRGGRNPEYQGDLEISIKNNSLILINDILMEDYLKKVVPSEMPTSWNIEALKAQSVAARTYAYREFYNRKYLDFGYVVDDSEMSQVYNNQNENQRSNQAISETKGITMFCEDEPIIAYYYSTSSGLSGSGNEVWIDDKVVDEIPYLIGRNLTNIEIDPNSEESMLNFFKQVRVDAPSNTSTNFRWKISMTKNQIREAINATISNMSKTYPLSYPMIKEDGSIYYDEFPSDIGQIKEIYVKERGNSGVVVSLEIVTEKLTFRIINQYNIRFTIRPNYANSEVIKYYGNGLKDSYSSQTKNNSILPSGYFALECLDEVITFYGGGSGHGVGMCQYGANNLANNGKTYQEILKSYYTNIYFIDTSKQYIPIDNYKELLK